MVDLPDSPNLRLFVGPLPTRERSALDVVLRCFAYAVGAETAMLLSRGQGTRTEVLAVWGLGRSQPYTPWVTNSLLGRAFDAPGAVVGWPSDHDATNGSNGGNGANGYHDAEAAVAAPVIGPTKRLGALYGSFADEPTLPKARLRWITESYAELAALCLEAGDGLAETLLASGVDRLTGCLSRDAALAVLDVEVERARREGGRVSCSLLNLDDLATINDALGHLAGNQILAAVGRELQQITRPYDSVGRLEGAAFMLILPGMNAGAARSSVERIQPQIAACAAEAAGFPSSISAGVAEWQGDQSAHALLEMADGALGDAKPGGGPVIARSARPDHGRDGLLELTRKLIGGRGRSADSGGWS